MNTSIVWVLIEMSQIVGWYAYDAWGKLIRTDPRAHPESFKLYRKLEAPQPAAQKKPT